MTFCFRLRYPDIVPKRSLTKSNVCYVKWACAIDGWVLRSKTSLYEAKNHANTSLVHCTITACWLCWKCWLTIWVAFIISLQKQKLQLIRQKPGACKWLIKDGDADDSVRLTAVFFGGWWRLQMKYVTESTKLLRITLRRCLDFWICSSEKMNLVSI